MPIYQFYFPGDGQKAEDAFKFFWPWVSREFEDDDEERTAIARKAAALHLETLHAEGRSDLDSDICVILDKKGQELGKFRVSVEWVPKFSAEDVK